MPVGLTIIPVVVIIAQRPQAKSFNKCWPPIWLSYKVAQSITYNIYKLPLVYCFNPTHTTYRANKLLINNENNIYIIYFTSNYGKFYCPLE